MLRDLFVVSWNCLALFFLSFIKVLSVCFNQVSLLFLFSFNSHWLKTAICQFGVLHYNSRILTSNSNTRTWTCTHAQLTLQMATFMIDIWSSTFFLLQVSKCCHKSKIKYQKFRGGCPHAVVANVLNYIIVVSSNSNHSITFTFRIRSIGKIWTPLSPKLWAK